MDRPERQAGLRALGFAHAAAFVADLAPSFDEVWQGTGSSLILVRARAPNAVDVLYVELRPSAEGRGWDVNSGGVFRRDYFEKGWKKPLWRRSRTAP